jgi:ubiquitin-conjugating enzyme E2 I
MSSSAVNTVTLNRLIEERKAWRKDRPFGFVAKPVAGADGEIDLTKWECIVPGREGTIWEGAALPVTITFSNAYPAKPPRVAFPKGFYHPNIYPSGTVCLSILNEDEQWRPSITLKQILVGVQDLLNNPNEKSPAQSEAFMDYTNRRKKYEARVKEEVKKYPSKV